MSYHTYECCLSPSSTAMPSATFNQKHFKTTNHSKVSTSRKIKNILKPVLSRIFKSKLKSTTKRNSYIRSTEEDLDFQWISENENLANEELENRLIEEIQESPDDAAIFIFNDENGTNELHQINKDKFYIPVHFARTSAGTFFWTSAQKQPIEPFQIEWNFLDRWAQA